MEHYSKHISKDLAEALTEIIIFEAEEKGVDFRKCAPPAGKKNYVDTLQKHGDKWVIYYNDETGSTRNAYIVAP